MADSGDQEGKGNKKNQKRADKRKKARIEKLKQDGVVAEIMELQDPVGLLREKLQEAKNNKDHKLAAQIRHQIWIAQDTAAGCVPDAETLGVKFDLSDEAQASTSNTKKTAEIPSQPTSTETENSDLQIEKRLRNLKKKLNQIKTLKERQEKGETLEETQMQKLSTEDDVITEIDELDALLSGKLKI